MLIKFKTRQAKLHERRQQLVQWRRKWAWWPVRIDMDNDDISTWIWMRWYFRRDYTSVHWRYIFGFRYYYLDFTKTQIVLDEFQLLTKLSEADAQHRRAEELLKAPW